MNLKINGTEMIRGIYCKAGENAVSENHVLIIFLYFFNLVAPYLHLITIELSTKDLSTDKRRFEANMYCSLSNLHRR